MGDAWVRKMSACHSVAEREERLRLGLRSPRLQVGGQSPQIAGILPSVCRFEGRGEKKKAMAQGVESFERKQSTALFCSIRG